jgi:hypothetical protein
MGRFDEAAKQCEQMPEDAVHRKECLGRARLGEGRAAEGKRPRITSHWPHLAPVGLAPENEYL